MIGKEAGSVLGGLGSKIVSGIRNFKGFGNFAKALPSVVSAVESAAPWAAALLA
jgi:hypothetical protein